MRSHILQSRVISKSYSSPPAQVILQSTGGFSSPSASKVDRETDGEEDEVDEDDGCDVLAVALELAPETLQGKRRVQRLAC